MKCLLKLEAKQVQSPNDRACILFCLFVNQALIQLIHSRVPFRGAALTSGFNRNYYTAFDG
jgi:hypothetical protein